VISEKINRARWVPQSDEDREDVRETLEKILASSQFSNSRRYPSLLRYIVEQTLSGNIDQIKERTIGIEVFGRAPDYDTNSDTVVRYSAGEVRKRLAFYNHDASDARVQIRLSARSYHPEFYRIVEENGFPVVVSDEDHQPAEHASAEHFAPRVHRMFQKKIVLAAALTIVAIFLVWAGQRIWVKHIWSASDRFWSPITQANGPVIISPGGVGFTPISKTGTDGTDSSTQLPNLSFENGLAMGRIEALLSSKHFDYRIQPSDGLTLTQLRENPVVLIGAYNNIWTQRLLLPLRFHFAELPDHAIIDTEHPEKRWARDSSKSFTETPDYGLVARFHNPSTDSMVVVVGGLERYGTDAASQFAVSSHFLTLFDQQVGSDWPNKNIEVVIRVDVVNGRAGTPIIEKTYVW
jgi:hypothetical protein